MKVEILTNPGDDGLKFRTVVGSVGGGEARRGLVSGYFYNAKTTHNTWEVHSRSHRAISNTKYVPREGRETSLYSSRVQRFLIIFSASVYDVRIRKMHSLNLGQLFIS